MVGFCSFLYETHGEGLPCLTPSMSPTLLALLIMTLPKTPGASFSDSKADVQKAGPGDSGNDNRMTYLGRGPSPLHMLLLSVMTDHVVSDPSAKTPREMWAVSGLELLLNLDLLR